MEELERRREQLGAEIAQLEAEWVLSFFFLAAFPSTADGNFFSLDCIFPRLFCVLSICVLSIFFPTGDTMKRNWSIILTCCMNITTSKTLDSHFWAVLVR